MDATSDFLSSDAAQRIKDLRKSKIDVQQLQTDLRSGDRAALSRCITLIESSLPEHKLEAAQLLNTLEAKQNTVEKVRLSKRLVCTPFQKVTKWLYWRSIRVVS